MAPVPAASRRSVRGRNISRFAKRSQAMASSTGSSIWAIRTTCTSRSVATRSRRYRAQSTICGPAIAWRSSSTSRFISILKATGSNGEGMTLDIRLLTQALAARVIAGADELTALDSAIGDADHGLNMKRGFEAVLGDLDSIAAKPLPDALKAVGTALVMKVGGASGPLYGTLFLTLGKELGS